MTVKNIRCAKCAAVFPDTNKVCPVCSASEFIPFTVQGKRNSAAQDQPAAPVAIVRIIMTKVLGSLLVSFALCAVLFLAFTALRGQPIGNVFVFIARNWLPCLAFAAFITVCRLFEPSFWK